MVDRHPTRRRVLRAVAGIGSAIGVTGCVGTDSVEEGDTSTRSQAPEKTTTPTSVTTMSDPSTTASTRRATSPEASPAENATTTSAAGTSSTTAGEATRGTYTVGMYTDLYFDPIGLYVEPGESVSFELVSGVHSAAAYHPDNEAVFERRVPEGAPAWDTGVFDSVGAFRTVTFETPGTHDYFCLPHKQLGMIGRIVVGGPGGPAVETPNPDGDLPDSDRIVEEGSIPYEAFRSNGR